jgi:DNA-binding response OmpR family regulator
MRHKVLIIEDQFLIAMAIEDAVAALGYEVVGIAASRNQALDYLEEVDVALVDINLLDGASGIQIARELSRHGTTIVFMTANPEAVATGIEGALGVISKPVDDGDLARVLKFVAMRREGRNPPCPRNLKLFAN